MLKSRIIQLLIVIIMVVMGTKLLLVASEVRGVPILEQNINKFRTFNVSEEFLKKLQKGRTKEQWAESIAINYCAQGGKIKNNREPISVNSLYALMMPKEEMEIYQEKILQLLGDIQVFPVPKDDSGEADISYEDSWGGKRSYGGERIHEGCDIMTSNNVVGYFPVQSMTEGVVEKIGWLNLGGYRVGIRAPGGAYFYYAHLDEYAEGLEVGSQVKAGQTLGKMGDSGYGQEGTTGKFDTHLHVGIYMDIYGQEYSMNPYHILKYIQDYRKTFYQADEI